MMQYIAFTIISRYYRSPLVETHRLWNRIDGMLPVGEVDLPLGIFSHRGRGVICWGQRGSLCNMLSAWKHSLRPAAGQCERRHSPADLCGVRPAGARACSASSPAWCSTPSRCSTPEPLRLGCSPGCMLAPKGWQPQTWHRQCQAVAGRHTRPAPGAAWPVLLPALWSGSPQAADEFLLPQGAMGKVERLPENLIVKMEKEQTLLLDWWVAHHHLTLRHLTHSLMLFTCLKLSASPSKAT